MIPALHAPYQASTSSDELGFRVVCFRSRCEGQSIECRPVFPFPPPHLARSLSVFYDCLCHKFRAMSPDIRAHLSRTKDEYGDDYTEPTNAEALSQVRGQNLVVLHGQTLV